MKPRCQWPPQGWPTSQATAAESSLLPYGYDLEWVRSWNESLPRRSASTAPTMASEATKKAATPSLRLRSPRAVP